MTDIEVSKIIHTCLKLTRQVLVLRIKIIDSVGKTGQADDIRQATKELHGAAIYKINIWIKNWWSYQKMQLLDHGRCFYVLLDYVENMRQMESKALEMLEQVQQAMPKESAAILDEAVKTHKATLTQTIGLQAALLGVADRIKDKELEGLSKTSLIDYVISKKRDALIEGLQEKLHKPQPRL